MYKSLCVYRYEYNVHYFIMYTVYDRIYMRIIRKGFVFWCRPVAYLVIQWNMIIIFKILMSLGKVTSPHLILNINKQNICEYYFTSYVTWMSYYYNHNITCTYNIWHGWKSDRYVTLIKSAVKAYSNQERVSCKYTHTNTLIQAFYVVIF